ncbi:hypothetical protein BDM02DRAFT_3000697 [Thelephora ganbajun]|uniref:Uncharacterized protein n=1 Tax=Thelephora ganbajun TaxID=370292 RepID=A0ACB6ZB03_THEGA|nr:hypothetical protein BDM02DRAFT_3000697 [Thelephora ganbajun]
MLIARLIGGVILLASFSLRMPQASSALSFFFTAFKSAAPASFLRQIEDVFPFSPTSTDSPPFYSDVVFSPSPAVTDLSVYYPPFQYSNLGSAASANGSAESVVREIGRGKCFLPLNRDGKPMSTPAAYFNIFLLLAPPCVILALYLTYSSFSLPDFDLGSRTNTLTHQNGIISAALLAANATCFVIVWPGGSWFNLRDYLSVVFGEAPQILLPPLIPPVSDVTVTILDEDEDEFEEDPDKTITPADFYRDEDTLSVCASPMLSPLSPIFSDCPSLTSDCSSSDESSKLCGCNLVKFD